MKGRGTRTVNEDDLRKVTPSARTKTHYVIVDAVGVTRTVKTATRPLDTKPSVSFRDLGMGVVMGVRDDDALSSLAARLSRLDRQLAPEERQRIEDKAGRPLKTIVHDLFSAIDGDRIAAAAAEATGQAEPDEAALAAARETLVDAATKVFNGPLVDLLDTIRRDHEQTIDHETLDKVIRAGWAGATAENAKAIVEDFAEWLKAHRDSIEALTIYFAQPARRSEVTHAMIASLLKILRADRPNLSPAHVWRAYAHLDDYKGDNPASELAQLVALVRRVAGLDEKLTAPEDRVRRNFQNWILKRHAGAGEKFDEDQMDWLRMIRDHVATSMRIERDDLDFTPFDAKGGLGKMFALFGQGMDSVMDEMNEALAG